MTKKDLLKAVTQLIEKKAIKILSPTVNKVATTLDGPQYSNWYQDLIEDYKKRGVIEGTQSTFNPILTNKYVEPIAEPLVSAARVGVYKAKQGVKNFVPTYIKSPQGEMFPKATWKLPREEQQKVWKDYFTNLAFGAANAPVPEAPPVKIPTTKLRISPDKLESMRKVSLVLEESKPIERLKAKVSPEMVASEKIPTQTAPKSLIQEATQKQLAVPEAKALPDIISKEPISVKQKVGILDYFRTPDRVLKKIGLEKESVFLRKQYNQYLKELPEEIDKITAWSREVPRESNQRIFKYLDGQEVELTDLELKVAGEIKTYLKTWADKLGLPEDKRITSYITHIFEKDFIQKEFDPEIAKIIQNKIPGSVYDPFVEKRLGKLGYVEDTWRALDAYVKRATRKVNMDPALKEIKSASKNLELSQFNYVKKYLDRVNLRPTEIDNLIDNTIKQVVGYKLGQRPVTRLARTGRQMVYRGTLGLNPGTAIKNLMQGSNTYAKLGERWTIKGYWDLLTKGTDELVETGVLRDQFIQDRTISVGKRMTQAMDKFLFVFFDTAEKINRGSAYYGAKSLALSKGLAEEEAIEAGLKMVRDTQFTFGSIDTPVVLQSDIAKLLGQFQSYSLKQGEFLGEMLANKEFGGLIRYALASTLLIGTIGKAIGMDFKDMIPSFRIGLPPTLQAPVEIGKALLGVPDVYGNVPDVKQRLKNVGRSLVPFLPAGTQGRKTLQGLEATGQGYSETSAGRVRYPVSTTPQAKIQGALFGQYNFPEARKYFKENLSPLGEKQTEEYIRLFSESPEKARKYYEKVIEDRKKKAAEKEAKEKGVVLAAEMPEVAKKFVERAKESYQKLTGKKETTEETEEPPTGTVSREEKNAILAEFRDAPDELYVVINDRLYYHTATGTGSVSLDFEVEKPEYTGEKVIDDELTAKYKESISTAKTAVLKAFELGYITQKEAMTQLEKLADQVKATKKTGGSKKLKTKPKFVPLKFGKRKRISGLTSQKKLKLVRPPKLKGVTLAKS